MTSHFPNLHLHTLFSEMFNSELPLTFLDSHQYYLLSDQQFKSFIPIISQVHHKFLSRTSRFPDLYFINDFRFHLNIKFCKTTLFLHLKISGFIFKCFSESVWTSTDAKLHEGAQNQRIHYFFMIHEQPLAYLWPWPKNLDLEESNETPKHFNIILTKRKKFQSLTKCNCLATKRYCIFNHKKRWKL